MISVTCLSQSFIANFLPNGQGTATLSESSHKRSQSPLMREYKNMILNQTFIMIRTLLFVAFTCYLDECSGAIDTGVIVFGTTVGPNYHRPEGIRRLFMRGKEVNTNLI